MLDVVTGYDCNVKCDYCTITPQMRARSLDTAAIARALRLGRARGHDSVQFGGGEPTIRADLTRLVQLARKLGFSPIKIQSNGLRYARDRYVDALVRAGANVFAISVMSHLPALYEKITGYPRAQAHVLQGIRNLRRHPVDLVADVIMKGDTYQHLPALVDFYAAHGIDDFVLWLVSLTDRNAAFPGSLVPVHEMFPSIAAACERGRARGVRVVSRHIPLCLLPGLDDHVKDTLSEDITVVTPDGTFDLRESAISANRYVSACEGCRHRPRCAGIRADYLDRFGEGEVKAL